MTTIVAVEGIGASFAELLKGAGVGTVEELLRVGTGAEGRSSIARETGIDEEKILEWVNRADLMRIKGVGSDFAGLLEAAGIASIGELSRQDPSSLPPRLLKANARKRLVRRVPSLTEITRWIRQATVLTETATTFESNVPGGLARELAEFYASAPRESDDERKATILALEGSISDEDAERMLAIVRELRENWR